MSFRRGDVVIVASGSGLAGKPRPALVIQDDGFADLSTVAVLLFTTHEQTHPLLRPEYISTPQNGLREASRLMVHAPTTVRRDEIGKRVGAFTSAEMSNVDHLLLLLLGFVRPAR